MPVATTIVNLNTMSGYVFRACWMVEYLRTSGAITAGQAAAILAAWNGSIRATAGVVQTTLPGAADQSQEALATWWNTPGIQFRTRCDIFGQALLTQFPEQQINQHPGANWGVLIRALAATL